MNWRALRFRLAAPFYPTLYYANIERKAGRMDLREADLWMLTR